MADMLKMALLWKLIVCGAERVVEAAAAGSQAVAEEMEQIFRETLLPLVDMPVDEAKAQKEVLAPDVRVRSNSREETDGEDGVSTLTDQEKRYLRAIEENPDALAMVLMKRAKLNGSNVIGIREGLVTQGLVEVKNRRNGKGLQKISSLTPKGKEALKNLSQGNGVVPSLLLEEAKSPAAVHVVAPIVASHGLQSSVSPQIKAGDEFLRAVSLSKRPTFGHIQRTTGLKGRRFGEIKNWLVTQGWIVVDEQISPDGGRFEKVCKITLLGEMRLKTVNQQTQAVVAQT